MQTRRCPFYLALGHELTHVVTKEMLGDNYGINEGLTDFVSFHNGGQGGGIECGDDGEYANLSLPPSAGGALPAQKYYETGFCFWQDFVKTYGYPNFVRVMQKLYEQSRGIDDYYVLDVMEEVIGESMSAEILDRYSLTREATSVAICKNCEMFLQ